MQSSVSLFLNTTRTLPIIFRYYSMHLLSFFKASPDRVILVPLGETAFDDVMVPNDVTGVGELVVCSGATLSGNFVVVAIKLSELNFWVSLSFAGIKCLRFLITTFLFLFKTLHDCGQLLWFTTMLFLSQRFCLLVQILMVFSCRLFGK